MVLGDQRLSWAKPRVSTSSLALPRLPASHLPQFAFPLCAKKLKNNFGPQSRLQSIGGFGGVGEAWGRGGGGAVVGIKENSKTRHKG